jgi:hypothetical protein
MSGVIVKGFNGGEAPSITAVYDYIIALMTALCKQHGEPNVFIGDPSYQIALQSPSTGESVSKVTNLTGAIAGMMDVVEQGAGMAQNSTDIDPGPLGGAFAHHVRTPPTFPPPPPPP